VSLFINRGSDQALRQAFSASLDEDLKLLMLAAMEAVRTDGKPQGP